VSAVSTVSSSHVPPRASHAAWLATLLLLAAINMRTAVTSVGPLLDVLERRIGLSSAMAGVLTTLPVLAFAGLGAITPRFARRFGEARTLAVALGVMTMGVALRSVVNSAWLFLALSVPALAGGAMGNIVLPVLVKRHFPRRIGPLTAAYTTVMAIGTTLAAGLTVPIAELPGHLDWRLGVGVWAIPAAAATLLWLPPASGAHGVHVTSEHRTRLPIHRSGTAWALAILFASQSIQAYVAFGWFAAYFQAAAHSSPGHAGLLVAVLSAVQIPVSLLVPVLAGRLNSQRPLVVGLVACYLAAYLGMIVSPRAGDWAWATLAGIGGGVFPLVLALLGLRARTAAVTRTLSAFAQSIGYIVAGTGPLLVGVTHGAFHNWIGMFVMLFTALAAILVSGWWVGVPRYVDDDLPSAYSPAISGTSPTWQPLLPASGELRRTEGTEQ